MGLDRCSYAGLNNYNRRMDKIQVERPVNPCDY